jgi:hypothetical protein
MGVVPGGWWGWQPIIFGPSHVETNVPEIQAKMQKVIADDKKRRLETWSKIESILIDSRRQLSAKYKIDF